MKALAIGLIIFLAAGVAQAEVNTITRVLLPTSEAAISAGSGASTIRSIDPGREHWFGLSYRESGASDVEKLYLAFEEDFAALTSQGYLLSTASLRVNIGYRDITDGNGTYLDEPIWLDAATIDPFEGVDYVTADALPSETRVSSISSRSHFDFSVPASLDISKPMKFCISADITAHMNPPTTPEEERYWNLYFECLDDEVPEAINLSEQGAPWLVLTFTKPAVKTTEPASWGGVKALYQ